MKLLLMCRRVLKRTLLHPSPLLGMLLFWILMRSLALLSSGRETALSDAADASALAGCQTALSLQGALSLLEDREQTVLYRLKAAGAGDLLQFFSFLLAFLALGAVLATGYALFLLLTGLPFQGLQALLPLVSVLPALFYASLGILCGSLLSRNGIWLFCVFLSPLFSSLGSGLILDWGALSPGMEKVFSFLPVNVFARFFSLFLFPGGTWDGLTLLLPIGYALFSALCALFAMKRCLDRQ